jgi:hypothetical protein
MAFLSSFTFLTGPNCKFRPNTEGGGNKTGSTGGVQLLVNMETSVVGFIAIARCSLFLTGLRFALAKHVVACDVSWVLGHVLACDVSSVLGHVLACDVSWVLWGVDPHEVQYLLWGVDPHEVQYLLWGVDPHEVLLWGVDPHEVQYHASHGCLLLGSHCLPCP